MNYLTDNELIDHTIKHDTDPVRVRLATYMERVSGAIVDDLIDAGMDNTWCNFRSVVNGAEYHPGQYISHLENEIDYLNKEIAEQAKELEKLKSRTILELIDELRQEIKTEKYAKIAEIEKRKIAEQNEAKMKHKLDMWAILNR